MADIIIHWFRRDLRLEDNTSLNAALGTSSRVLPLYLLDDRILLQPTMGAARLRFLRSALRDLDQRLRERGSRLLVMRTDDVPRELNRLVEETGGWSVYFNRDYTPYARARDQRATRGLQMTGIVTQTFADQLLVEPYATADAEGEPALEFDVFRERWLAALDLVAEPARVKGTLVEGAALPAGLDGWDGSWADAVADDSDWPGATPATARSRLRQFLASDLAAGDGSRLSAALKFGTISARQVARALVAAGVDETARGPAEAVLEGLCRRDFAHQLAFARPDLLRPPPAASSVAFEAWRTGSTGTLEVDAIMQRLETGAWLPVSDRLAAARALVGVAGGRWGAGAAHFMRTLVDADVACNALGWRDAATAID